MKLPTELLFLTTLLLPPISSAPATPALHRRSASFASVLGLTPLNNDFSDLETVSHPTKFFHESTFSYHYDGRFASSGLPHEERLEHLRLMLRAYTSTMARIGVRTCMDAYSDGGGTGALCHGTQTWISWLTRSGCGSWGDGGT
jgi:hypothetical protein